MKQRVPTLPTPTALRAASTNSNRSSNHGDSTGRLSRYVAQLAVYRTFELIGGQAVGTGQVA